MTLFKKAILFYTLHNAILHIQPISCGIPVN